MKQYYILTLIVEFETLFVDVRFSDTEQHNMGLTSVLNLFPEMINCIFLKGIYQQGTKQTGK